MQKEIAFAKIMNLSVFDPYQLETLLTKVVDAAFENKLAAAVTPPKQEEEFLTRAQTAKKLGIALSTLHEYTMAGKIKGYRFGSRVRYKRSEIEQALIQIQGGKA